MSARSRRHHEVPKWLLKNFCQNSCEMLWMGFKDTHEVRLVNVNVSFVRRDANTRTSYQNRGDGTVQKVKSDQDEKILAKFDAVAARAARELIAFSRQWRDEGAIAPRFSPGTMEICKQLIITQSRRTWESQDRAGLSRAKYELYLDLYFKRAEEVGYVLPSRESLLEDSNVTSVFDGISHNTRAKFASGNHPILANKEKRYLAPLGLQVAILDLTTDEFVIGSHGTTIVETTQGRHTWLPLGPDVAISFSDQPGFIGIGICTTEFVECHNRAALSASSRVAGWSEGKIRELLTLLD